MLVSLTPPTLAVAVDRWAVSSQQRARRNAMIAATECAQRRAEREDVDDFLAAHASAAAAPSVTRPGAAAAQG